MTAFRNQNYLDWVRQRDCCVSGKPAQVSHHVRKGDNISGVGIKPSDYRVIPLTNFYHTISDYSVHRMGEGRFYLHFGIEVEKVQIELLTNYLLECYQLSFSFLAGVTAAEKIELLEEAIESRRCDCGIEKMRQQELNKKVATLQQELRQKVLLANEQKHREDLLKARQYQKELREKQKLVQSESLQQSEFKQKQKELARSWRRERYQELKAQQARNVTLET